MIHIRAKTLDYESEIKVVKKANEIVEERHMRRLANEAFNFDSNRNFWASRAAAKVAQRLSETSPDPLVLCISGGLDSQAMLFSFLESGVPFKVAVLEYANRLNEHDIGHGLSLLTDMGVPYSKVSLDIEKFYESGDFLKYAQGANTNSPQFAAHIWFAEQNDGVPVFAGEPWHWHSESGHMPAQDYYVPQFKEYGVVNYLKKQNREAVSHFFELSLEWLEKALAQTKGGMRLRTDRDPEKSYQAKYAFYRQLGFPVRLTSGMVKLNGFERLYALTAARQGIKNFYYFNKIYREPLEADLPNATKRKFYIDGAEGLFWDFLRSL